MVGFASLHPPCNEVILQNYCLLFLSRLLSMTCLLVSGVSFVAAVCFVPAVRAVPAAPGIPAVSAFSAVPVGPEVSVVFFRRLLSFFCFAQHLLIHCQHVPALHFQRVARLGGAARGVCRRLLIL